LIPVSGLSAGTLKEVLHIEGGKMTLIKIKAPSDLEGSFYAEVENNTSKWEYACTIYQFNQNYLFCFGGKLPEQSEAVINVFLDAGEGRDAVLVFTAEILVPVLLGKTQ
jgi:hypothetical protein